MYNNYKPYPCPYFINYPMYRRYNNHKKYPCPYYIYPPNNNIKLKDYGPNPYVVNIEEATIQNENFRTALWTGDNLQVTLMSIDVGDDIGLETHPDVDQFIRIEEGEGLVKIGNDKDNLCFKEEISDDFAIMIPAGKWHNIINTGDKPLKLYSIYAPPEHPFGTIHKTKDDEKHNYN